MTSQSYIVRGFEGIGHGSGRGHKKDQPGPGLATLNLSTMLRGFSAI